MLLCADLGNTCVTLGCFEDNKLLAEWRVRVEDFTELDSHWNQRSMPEPQAVVLGSVNPPAEEVLSGWIRRRFELMPLRIGREIKIKMPVLLEKPEELGADRLLNALAGFSRFGGPLIIVDFGSAVTFDVVSAKGEYLGGAIAPGIRLSAQALAEKTALLPEVKPKSKPPLIGRSTKEAIASGLYYGFLGLISEMVKRISQDLGTRPKVIATGGDAPVLAPEMPEIDETVATLTLDGLRLAYAQYLDERPLE